MAIKEITQTRLRSVYNRTFLEHESIVHVYKQYNYTDKPPINPHLV